MPKLLTSTAVAILLGWLLLSPPSSSLAAGGVDIRLTVVAPIAGLHVKFSPEGINISGASGAQPTPLLIPFSATEQVPGDEGLPCKGERCYTMPPELTIEGNTQGITVTIVNHGHLVGSVRGGILAIYQTDPQSGKEQLVARDPISWTFMPGTVADLVAYYSITAVGEMQLVDFRRTDVPLTPIAYPHLAPEITPLAVGSAVTATITATTPLSGTVSQSQKAGGLFTGCAVFLVILAVLLGVIWVIARISQPRTIADANVARN